MAAARRHGRVAAGRACQPPRLAMAGAVLCAGALVPAPFSGKMARCIRRPSASTIAYQTGRTARSSCAAARAWCSTRCGCSRRRAATGRSSGSLPGCGAMAAGASRRPSISAPGIASTSAVLRRIGRSSWCRSRGTAHPAAVPGDGRLSASYFGAMCARYSSSLPPELLARVFGTVNELPNFPANYNLAPTQLAPVVRRHPDSGERHLDLLRWGLLPYFAADPKRQRPINARAETVASTGMFRDAFARRRCLVPAAAFYEWRTGAGASKRPFAVARADGTPLALAGVWEGWRAPGRGRHRAHVRDHHDGRQRAAGADPQSDARGDRGGGLARVAGRGRGRSGGAAAPGWRGRAAALACQPARQCDAQQ